MLREPSLQPDRNGDLNQKDRNDQTDMNTVALCLTALSTHIPDCVSPCGGVGRERLLQVKAEQGR